MEKKEIILLVIGIAILIWIGKPEISLDPFSIKFLRWQNMLGLIFLTLSLAVFRSYSYKEGKKDAYKEINEIIEQELKNKNE